MRPNTLYWIIGIAVIGIFAWLIVAQENLNTAQREEGNANTISPYPTAPTENMVTTADGVMVGGALMVKGKDVVDNLTASNEHTKFVEALRTAGLETTLKGPGPYTVFAPVDAAFDRLPTGTKTFATVNYHVVAGRYTLADLQNGVTLTTLSGKQLTIKQENGVWMVNNAQVLIPDVVSSNGVIFIIDSALQ